MSQSLRPAIWFPALRAESGADVFTTRLTRELRERGIRAEITWLPPRSEYVPWTVPAPVPPPWANVVHVNTWLHSRFIPPKLPVLATLHHAVHRSDAHDKKGALRSAYHRYWIAPIERSVMRRADTTVAVSKLVADSSREFLSDENIPVIYNGIDTSIFCPGTRLRQGGEPFRLLYIGNWLVRKGVDLLAPILQELGDGFELHYTGGSVSEKDRMAMPSNMIDIGRLEGDAEVAAAMQNADALLFPSRSEGFGLVAVEAMGCGLPVIATRKAPFTELIHHGETGMLCAQDDIRMFAMSVRRLAGDLSLYAQIAAAARRYAKRNFSIKKMTRAYEAAYISLLERSL